MTKEDDADEEADLDADEEVVSDDVVANEDVVADDAEVEEVPIQEKKSKKTGASKTKTKKTKKSNPPPATTKLTAAKTMNGPATIPKTPTTKKPSKRKELQEAVVIAKAAQDNMIKEVARSLGIKDVETITTRNLNNKIVGITGMNAETFKQTNQDPMTYS